MVSSSRLDITYQTLYSELVQRSLDESFTSEFSSEGRFVDVEVKGKKDSGISTPGGPMEAGRTVATSHPRTIRRSPKGWKPSET